ncbi:hypothetical protein BH10BAC6_BH10BAC6_04860 [soil metagenome]
MATIVGALVLVTLERVLPRTKGQRLFRKGFGNDLLWYTLVQSYVLGLMIYGLIGMIDNELALSRWALIRAYPVWMQCVLFLVVHDVYIYWFHRWHHSANAIAHNKNFSTKFAVWDWLFGTAYRPRMHKSTSYGLGTQEFPSSYYKQIAYAFRRDPTRGT